MNAATQSKKTKTIELEWHDSQWSVFNDPTRFKVLFCGRRWGKTRGAIQWLTMKTLSKHEQLGWWVSPTYRQAKIAYRYFRKIFRNSGIICKYNQTDLTIDLPFNCRIEFRSAEIPDNLRGEGVDFLVVDEFPTINEEVWIEVLRATLFDSRGEAVFCGTPKGMNWGYHLWMRGQGNDPEWKSWRFSTYDNPYINKDEIKSTEKELPEITVRQEIYAEAIEGSGMVFRNVDECCTSTPEEPQPGAKYSGGIDLAKYNDFTVQYIRRGNRVIFMERFNQIDWAIQKTRLLANAKRYNNAHMYIDSTGVGDPIFEDLQRAGMDVEPFRFTAVSKKDLIDNLIIKMDKREVEILDDVITKSELKSYEYELTSGGRLRTNAPSGRHDDCVIALALCFWQNAEPAALTWIRQLVEADAYAEAKQRLTQR